ncbi:ElaA protein [Actinoplanes ianthinogenes]|uniref:ElaA protein n=1 Tax=Actinoplanes ianthinogenes TaxID=122358 RepID=A0ABM7LSL2_9ACTN|nr:GNAT family N-acetyltransferase [Actinoplanes ianthinogenes]BCJ42243.1 ElaA protein [Actinoplanes ianthinogenes]GGR55056.1 ElaA protein [Actinoplanes ianthinogenes]
MHPLPHDEFRVASFRDLPSPTLYDILRLRSEVFVVEQKSIYLDLDGRDTEPGTRHLWFSRDREVRAYLRILDDHGAERIGRVVTSPKARGEGMAGRLMGHALEIIGHRHAVLDAQSYLVGFYRKYGFEPTGPEYVEDGIPHVPMAREITAA